MSIPAVCVATISGHPLVHAGSASLPRIDVLPVFLSRELLIEAIELAACEPRWTVERYRQRHRSEIAAIRQLTERQVAILECIGSGWSNEEIAVDQCIGVFTLERDIKMIRRRINVPSRTQIVRWAIHHGLSSRPWHARSETPTAPATGEVNGGSALVALLASSPAKCS